MNETNLKNPFSEEVWETTYKDQNMDFTINDTLKRVANAIASVEKTDELKAIWADNFYDMLSDFKCTIGGRIYANAGAKFSGTSLLNCFVSPRDRNDIDSIDGILGDVLNQCKTLKSEGGWGQNFCFKFNELLNVTRNDIKLFIPIEDVISGDLVYSSDGKLHLVEETLSTIKEDMVTLTFDNGSTVTCTDDHPFLAIRNGIKTWILSGDLEETDEIVTI